MAKMKDRYQLDPLSRIPDVWILDSSFQKLGLIDDYTSLIWSRRYYEVGDFELYVRVTDKSMSLLNVDLSSTVRFIMRNDTKEVMRVEKVEISVDAEEGDFITASGRDLRCLLYQRVYGFDKTFGEIIDSEVTGEPLMNNSVYVPNVIYDMVNTALVNAEPDERKMPYQTIGTTPSIDNVSTTAMMLSKSDNVGEKTEELCTDFRIGWRNEWNGSKIVFECYEGSDKTDSVIFSEEFANLIKLTSTEDLEDFYNVMMLYNKYTDEQGVEHENDTMFGNSSGFVRFEKAFSGSDDFDIPSTSALNALAISFKLPTSYNVRVVDVNYNSDNEITSVIDHGSDYPNDEDDGHTGNDYMSSDPRFIITGYKVDTVGIGNRHYYIDAGFLRYDFTIYSDEWLNTLKGYFDQYGGHIETVDGVDVYRVGLDSNGKPVIKVTGYAYVGYWPWDRRDNLQPYWNLTIPAQYSDTGEAVDFQMTKFPLGIEMELPSILVEDRYMAKAYSMVEESLSTGNYEGEIAPDVNYTYREDYDIGDRIRIRTDIGIEKDVRITEAVETFDSDGYNIEVKFGV